MSAHCSWKRGKFTNEADNISTSKPAFRYAATFAAVPSMSIGSMSSTTSDNKYEYCRNCRKTSSGPSKHSRNTSSVLSLAASRGAYSQGEPSVLTSGSNMRYCVRLQNGTSSYSQVLMASVTLVALSRNLTMDSMSSSGSGTSVISCSSATKLMLSNGAGMGLDGLGMKLFMKSTHRWIESSMNVRIWEDKIKSNFRSTRCNGDFMYTCKSSQKKLCSSASLSVTSAMM
mmetsp:Transcript_24998/g.71874  ORF Transcript_24998/g.71874 Transcript_24998/m.71874 type:complete len:229 (-) Transcript_24998:436-1122(-)